MPLTKPDLTTVAPGLPITAGGWNAILDGINALYDALGPGDRDYINLAIQWRGRPVLDAQAVAIPVNASGDPAGPALAAVPPIGLLTTHQLVGVTPGTWKIVVSAPGFAPATTTVTIGALATSGPSGSTQVVELVRPGVPPLDLVGYSVPGATEITRWAGMVKQAWDLLPDHPTSHVPQTVVIAGLPSGDIPSGTANSLLFTDTDMGRGPWRAMVPDLAGWDDAASVVANFDLLIGDQATAQGATGHLRVLSQSPSAGQIVTPGTPVNLTFGGGDDNSLVFGQFANTHTKLAAVNVRQVVLALRAAGPPTDGSSPPGPALPGSLGSVWGMWWAPWEVARTYLPDSAFNALVAFFAAQGATVTEKSGEDLAAIWSSCVVVINAGRFQP